ncbi:hypothetical protein [Marinobacter sp. HL-58]|uniref:hypothetical protein n=1 Tax=Marinobacter sp. HL-58 TaxID=1479237 RepID=UPI0006D9C7CA|nr:hypothetical protein [Marinobacter sp. HL-58]KPP98471.1 MAG: integron cassette protein [Marinobacter sp. HL-58]
MDLSVSQYVVIAGLVCDVIGCVLVAFEVINRFKGQIVEQSQKLEDLDFSRPVLTSEYRKWEKCKHIVMAIGLFFLVGGFTLQGIGTAIQ